MTDSRRSHESLVLLAGALTALFLLPSAMQAEPDSRSLSRTKYTNGAAVRRVFGDVVAQANNWTVRVKADDELVAYGTIVRADGYVVSKASQLTGRLVCRLSDGRELPARYIGYNAEHDIALLKIDAENLEAVDWRDGMDPSVGSWVITPDQQGTPDSVGVVSVTRRMIPQVREPAILGIKMIPETAPVVVEEVFDGSAAERARLQAGDVIQRVNDVPIVSPESLKHEISRCSPGDTISLTVERGDESLTLRATLTHPFGDFQSRIAMQNHMGGDLSQRRTGFPAVLQHDSVIHPYECGGPLVDLSGRAIGINIARAGRTESYAIPGDVLRPLIDELLRGNSPPPGEQQPTVAAGLTDENTAVPSESDASRQ